jgi:hypothetical protein
MYYRFCNLPKVIYRNFHILTKRIITSNITFFFIDIERKKVEKGGERERERERKGRKSREEIYV